VRTVNTFLSWSGFLINEVNAWKNGQSVDSLVNEDGNPAWHAARVVNDIFECASVDAARALENSLRRGGASAVVL